MTGDRSDPIDVFINYRRDDSGGHAGRLFDHLVSTLGRDHVFMDVEAISPGADFVQVIQRAVDGCDALIAVIGPRWLAATPEGSARIDDPDDFVRLEIATALAHDIEVFPVLVDGASMPKADRLPDDMAPLAVRNAIALDTVHWGADVERLLEAIRSDAPVAGTCPSCGRDNPAGFAFCGVCGAPLTPEPEALEERKVVTVMLCELVGEVEGADPELVRARVAPFHALLRAETERHGGRIEQMTTEIVTAVFGAPVAHEDDPERAVRAALAVLGAGDDGPGRHPPIRIGIDTGEAVVSRSDRPDPRGPIVMGQVVTSAWHLQHLAPAHTALVGGSTHDATVDIIAYDRFESEQPGAPVWRVREAIARLGTETDRRDTTTFVGRRDELEQIRQAYTRAVSTREPQLVVVAGEAGAGKSRLLREFSGWVDDLPELVAWRQGRCLPYGDNVTFWSIAEIVRAHAGIYDSDTAATAREKLDSAVGIAIDVAEDRAWVASTLSSLVGATSTDAGGAEISNDELFTVLRRCFEGISDAGPLILVFEDLHWAAAPMLSLIEHLVGEAVDAPILVVGTARPELRELHQDFARDLGGTAWIPLSRLTEEQTADLVTRILGAVQLPAEVRESLVARAGGNPLFAEQFAGLVLDREHQRAGEGSGQTQDLQIEIPESISAILASRLDALEPNHKRLVSDAAVVGKVFWSGAVTDLGHRQPKATGKGLKALAHKEFIRRARRSSVEGDEEYAFGHVLIRDTAYSQIMRSERAAKHLAVADWIEGLSGERRVDQLDLLIAHLQSAYDFDREAGRDVDELRRRLRDTLVEGAQAVKRIDASVAFNRAMRALDLTLPDEPGRAQLLLTAGRFSAPAARYQAQKPLLEEAIARAAAEDEPVLRAQAMLESMMRVPFGALGDRRREAVEIFEQHATPSDLADAYARLATLGLTNGYLDEAQEWLAKADAIPSTHATPAREAEFVRARGNIRMELGFSDAIDDLEQARDLYLKDDEPAARATSVDLAFAFLRIHGPKGVIERAEAIAEISRRRGFTGAEAYARSNISEAAFDLGHWEGSVEESRWQVRAGETLGAEDLASWGTFLLAAMAVARAQDVEVDIPSTADFARIGRIEIAIVSWLTCALAARAGDAPKEATAFMRELETRTSEMSTAGRAERLPEIARLTRWTREASTLRVLLQGLDLPDAPRMRGSVLLGQATMHELDDRFDQAFRDYTASIGALEPGRCVVDIAHARAGAGRCLAAMGRTEEARKALEAAGGTFENLSAATYLDEVNRYLEGIGADAT